MKNLTSNADAQEAEATPIENKKWQVVSGNYNKVLKSINLRIMEGQREVCGKTYCNEPLTDDFEKIVKCVNMYDELIVALANLKSQIDTLQLEDRIKYLPNERRNLLSASLLIASNLLKQTEQK